VTEVKYLGLQSNHDVWTVTLLNKKNCVLIIDYKFWLSGNCLILTIGIKIWFLDTYHYNKPLVGWVQIKLCMSVTSKVYLKVHNKE